jgi:hypothetical protein
MSNFKHSDTGVFFNYGDAGSDAVLAPPPQGGRNVVYPHKVYLNNAVHEQGWRHALVKGSVAYVITDEIEGGDGIVYNVCERWAITSHVR